MIIIAEAEGLLIACVAGAIALILFIGGILLVFSTKPQEYKSAAWMSGIAFFLLWSSIENIETLKISFLEGTGFLELTAIAFAFMGWFEESHPKKYIYATLAFLYIRLTAPQN